MAPSSPQPNSVLVTLIAAIQSNRPPRHSAAVATASSPQRFAERACTRSGSEDGRMALTTPRPVQDILGWWPRSCRQRAGPVFYTRALLRETRIFTPSVEALVNLPCTKYKSLASASCRRKHVWLWLCPLARDATHDLPLVSSSELPAEVAGRTPLSISRRCECIAEIELVSPIHDEPLGLGGKRGELLSWTGTNSRLYTASTS